MNSQALAIITTRLPPATCGIGAYSWLLRQHWPGPVSEANFIVLEANGAVLSATDRQIEFSANGASLTSALQKQNATDAILHYTGRAYHRYGLPIWLPRALRAWKRRVPHARLMVIFHEVPGGDLPVTSPHHWLGRVEVLLIRQLTRIADGIVTNTAWHQKRLREISGRADVEVVPVGSNIEAPVTLTVPRMRTEFVLFGLPYGRWQTCQRFESHLRNWHASGLLTKLHVIGPSEGQFGDAADAILARCLPPTAIERHGSLPMEEVAHYLQRAQFALTNLTAATWSKSGAFMAYAAHGCTVIMDGEPATAIPLCYAVMAAELPAISETELASKSARLRDWYHANADWPVIAARIAAVWKREEAVA